MPDPIEFRQMQKLHQAFQEPPAEVEGPEDFLEREPRESVIQRGEAAIQAVVELIRQDPELAAQIAAWGLWPPAAEQPPGEPEEPSAASQPPGEPEEPPAAEQPPGEPEQNSP